MKTQVIIEQETRKIIATSFSLGKKHDYALFKESKIPILKNTKLIVVYGFYKKYWFNYCTTRKY
ncbi:hypothetical protein [Spiroplasma endosymbiont of Eupeodes luniger]|uniref:hypothetical protein n=1 Tax=Spiroplasma endosymbiont of Eupeodes luniger TaxID=3066300 RepID=UPI003BB0E217